MADEKIVMPTEVAERLRESGAINESQFDKIVNDEIPKQTTSRILDDTEQDIRNSQQAEIQNVQQEQAPSGQQITQEIDQMRAEEQTAGQEVLQEEQQVGQDVLQEEQQVGQEVLDAAEQAPLTPEQIAERSAEQTTSEDFVRPEGTEAPVARAVSGAEGVERAFDLQAAGQLQKAQLQRQQLTEEARLAREKQAQLEQFEQDTRKKLAQQEAKIGQEVSKLDAITKQLSEAKVDPDRLVDNQSTGRKILAFIGIALGGLGGGANQALQAFQRTIDADIKSQEDEIQQLGKLARGRTTLIGEMRKQFSNLNQARSAAKIVLLDRFKAQLQANAARFAAPQIQANAQAALGQLELQKQQELVKFRQASDKLRPSPFDVGEVIPEDIRLIDLPKEDQKRLVRLPDGRSFIANSEPAQKKFLEVVGAANLALPKLRKFQDLLETDFLDSSRLPFSTESAQAKSLTEAIIGALRVPFTGPGVLQLQERQNLIKAIGRFGLFGLPELERTKIRTVIETLEDGVKASAQTAGLKDTNILSFEPEEPKKKK